MTALTLKKIRSLECLVHGEYGDSEESFDSDAIIETLLLKFNYVCGENKHGHKMGCGEKIEEWEDIYRCADCEVPFHKHCIRDHFVKKDI